MPPPANAFSLSVVTIKLLESIIVSSSGKIPFPTTISSINPLNEFVALPIFSKGINIVPTAGRLPIVSINSSFTYNIAFSFLLANVK